jgi:hypothetical protein
VVVEDGGGGRDVRSEEVRVKSNFVLRSQIDLQLLKIWTQRWKLLVLGKRLERISNFSQRESRLL